MSEGIPILLYHRIDDSGDRRATSPADFERHLRLLYEHGWKSLSAEEFAAIAHRESRPLPRSFLLTFDDGYESIRTIALDLLRKFDFKALCFISTALIRNASDATISMAQASRKGRYLSWSQIRELQSSGIVDCHSHSHTHGKFLNFSTAEMEEDLGTSVDILSYQLRISRKHFSHLAWPWGLSFSDWRATAARAGFRLQYSVARQAYRPGSSIQQIPRACFDQHSFGKFQRELWLQTGQLSLLWDAVYPYGRKARYLWKTVRRQYGV